jgi:hypothetical protein
MSDPRMNGHQLETVSTCNLILDDTIEQSLCRNTEESGPIRGGFLVFLCNADGCALAYLVASACAPASLPKRGWLPFTMATDNTILTTTNPMRHQPLSQDCCITYSLYQFFGQTCVSFTLARRRSTSVWPLQLEPASQAAIVNQML